MAAAERKPRMCLMPACRGQRRDLVHKFPMNNARAERWRQIINDPQLTREPLDSMRKKRFICNRHFRPQDYKNVESRSLNSTAVPSLLLGPAAAAAATDDVNEEDDHCRVVAGDNNNAGIMLMQASASESDYAAPAVASSNSHHSVMRLEINFDTIEVVHASTELKPSSGGSKNGNLQPMAAQQPIEYVDKCIIDRTTDEDDAMLLLDDRDDHPQIISILEPSPNQANTYRLSTIRRESSRTYQRKHAAKASRQSILNANVSAAAGAFDCRSSSLTMPTHQKKTYDNNDDNEDGNNVADDDNENETSEMLLIPLSSESFMHLQTRLLQQQTQADAHPDQPADEIVLDDILMERQPQAIHPRLSTQQSSCDNADDDAAAMSPTVCCSSTTDAISTTVVHPAWSGVLQIAHFWLRDHCRCADCYNDETAQRKQNVLDIPIDIRPVRVDATSERNVLRVQWPDQHESVYDLTALCAHFGIRSSPKYGPAASILSPIGERTLWTAESIVKQPYARVTLNELLCDDSVARSIVASLVRFGVAFIEKVPANIQSTEVAVKRLFAVHKTLFGEMWSLTDNAEHADTAYSKDGLGAHTDNTYFNDAAGLQVLHCVQHNGTGGESLLLDGFRAVQAVRERDAAAYGRLCRRVVPAEYVEQGQHHTYAAPMVRLRPDSEDVEQIRFNLIDRALMPAMAPDKMLEFYEDLRTLSAEIQSPANEWWFKLRPGTVVIFDNWRLLHGRSAYTGRRQLCGCYVSRTEFQSVARTMGLIQ